MGDPSGIGPEIALKAANRLKGLAEFVIIGDQGVFGKSQNHKFVDLNNVRLKNFQFGKIKAEYGKASIEYLDKALELIQNKEIDCLVTCPISKESIRKAGFDYSGHTEYFSRRNNIKDFVMMLLNRELRIGLVTRHVPLKDVPASLSKEKIYKTVFLSYCALRQLFAINKPRIVVCGLNPHASDNGVIGDEENNFIKPAINELKKKIEFVYGPLSADVAIMRAREKLYDCVIAMYHDQALIPLKFKDADSGVNITLGLPFVRTSPLHGTAFDISGKGLANPASLIEAIKLAIRCRSNLKND